MNYLLKFDVTSEWEENIPLPRISKLYGKLLLKRLRTIITKKETKPRTDVIEHT